MVLPGELSEKAGAGRVNSLNRMSSCNYNNNYYYIILLFGHLAILFSEPPKPGACWSLLELVGVVP